MIKLKYCPWVKNSGALTAVFAVKHRTVEIINASTKSEAITIQVIDFDLPHEEKEYDVRATGDMAYFYEEDGGIVGKIMQEAEYRRMKSTAAAE